MMLFFSVLLGVFFNLVSSYCNGSISIESHAALAALFNSTAGMDWMWDPPLPSPTVWNFPSPLSAPCSESWQGLACSSNLNSDRCDVTEILLPGYGLMGPIQVRHYPDPPSYLSSAAVTLYTQSRLAKEAALTSSVPLPWSRAHPLSNRTQKDSKKR
jgi:hypothetical protein